MVLKESQYNYSMTNDQIVQQIIKERMEEALVDCKGNHAQSYAYVLGQLSIMLANVTDLAMTHNHKDARGYLQSKLRKSPKGKADQMVPSKIFLWDMGYDNCTM